jgi:hypothetical protein
MVYLEQRECIIIAEYIVKLYRKGAEWYITIEERNVSLS